MSMQWVDTLLRTAKSPDLNPIEYLWEQIETAPLNRQIPLRALNKLSEACEEEWDPEWRVQILQASMRRRCQAVNDSKDVKHMLLMVHHVGQG